MSASDTAMTSSEQANDLDDLTSALAGSFEVSAYPNNPNAPHPRFGSYKGHASKNDQQERRRHRMLALQKESRFNVQSHIRNLTENVWNEDGMEAEEEEEEEAMEVTQVKLRKPGRYYKNQLMYSEWMLDPPPDLISDWLMMPCPVGKRNLVVASRGETQAFSKSGFRLKRFPSSLPGGCRRGEHRTQSTILDCIYSEVNKTFYVLDMLNWKTHPLYDSETECRWFLTHSHFADNPEPKTVSKFNPYRFEPLSSYSCDPASIETVMSQEINFELDGLLFYHKRTHYTFGPTPLVLWLKAYMLPEVFSVRVGEEHLKNVPSSYQGFQQHVTRVKDDKKKKEVKPGCHGDAPVAMETQHSKS